MVTEGARWMRMSDRERRKRGRADQGEVRGGRQTEERLRTRESLNERRTDRKEKKPRERASGGAYYRAVTPLRCGSEWERLSTHYSSDLGGQLEESSINQTDAQAEADDSRQQCSKQPPPNTHPPINTTTSTPANPPRLSTSLQIYLHSSSAVLYFLSLSFCCLAFHTSPPSLFFLSLSFHLSPLFFPSSFSLLPPLCMP